MITLDSFNEKVIPSITDRVKCFRLCRLSIPIKLPEFDYLDTEFFLLLYRSKINPSLPTITSSIFANKSENSASLANVSLNHFKELPAANVTPME